MTHQFPQREHHIVYDDGAASTLARATVITFAGQDTSLITR
jgi:hypothetical protein